MLSRFSVLRSRVSMRSMSNHIEKKLIEQGLSFTSDPNVYFDDSRREHLLKAYTLIHDINNTTPRPSTADQLRHNLALVRGNPEKYAANIQAIITSLQAIIAKDSASKTMEDPASFAM